MRTRAVAIPQHYWQLLNSLCHTLEIWESEYLQVLGGENPLAEFVKGSWLKQFLDRLQEPERSAFEDDYRSRVAQAYPRRPDGHTLFPFRRVLIVAQRR